MHCLCDGLLLDKVNEEKKKNKINQIARCFYSGKLGEKNGFCVTNEEMAG